MEAQPPNSRQLPDGSVVELSSDELQSYRDRATALQDDPHGFMMRSCWNCNGAHLRLAAIDDAVLGCFGCGRYFLQGADITIYSEPESSEHGDRSSEGEPSAQS